MLDEVKKRLNEYEIAAITSQNFEQAFEVYNSNQDFFLLTQGEKATIKNSINDINVLPPECGEAQKMYAGIWENGRAVGVLDLYEKYPEPTCVWIGLLLIRGDLHGKKIGSKAVSAVLSAAKTSGYKYVQLGVVEGNTWALRFWQKQGFEIFRQSGNISVMVKDI